MGPVKTKLKKKTGFNLLNLLSSIIQAQVMGEEGQGKYKNINVYEKLNIVNNSKLSCLWARNNIVT